MNTPVPSALGTYNTDPALWVPFFRAYPATNLTYCDGAVYVDGKIRAVFPTNAAAMAAMSEARRQAASLPLPTVTDLVVFNR